MATPKSSRPLIVTFLKGFLLAGLAGFGIWAAISQQWIVLPIVLLLAAIVWVVLTPWFDRILNGSKRPLLWELNLGIGLVILIIVGSLFYLALDYLDPNGAHAVDAMSKQKVSSAVFNADATQMLYTADGLAHIRDIGDGKEILTISPQYTSPFRAVAYSQADHYLAFADDTSIRLWDLDAGALERQILNVPRNTLAMAFNADDRWIAAAGDGWLKVWKTKTGELAWSAAKENLPSSPITFLTFSMNAKYLAAASGSGDVDNDKTIYLYDPANIEPVRMLPGMTEQKLYDCLNRTRGRQPVIKDGINDPIRAISFSRDGKFLYSVNASRRLVKHNVENGTSECDRNEIVGTITTATFDPNHERWAASNAFYNPLEKTSDNSIGVFTMSIPSQHLYTLEGAKDDRSIFYLGFGPRGSSLVAIGKDANNQDRMSWWSNLTRQPAKRWHRQPPFVLVSPTERKNITPEKLNIGVVAWNMERPSEQVAVIPRGNAPEIALWNMTPGETPTQPLALRGTTQEIVKTAYTGDGDAIITVSRDGYVRRWNGNSLVAEKYWHDAPIVGLAALGPDRVVLANERGSIGVWNTLDNSLVVNEDRKDENITVLTAHPDKIHFVTGATGGQIRKWDADNLASGGIDLGNQDARVTALAFSTPLANNAVLLASAGSNDQIKVWDWNTGALVSPPLTVGLKGATILRFDADAGKLVIAGALGDIYVWDRTPANPMPGTGEQVVKFKSEESPVVDATMRGDRLLVANGEHAKIGEPGSVEQPFQMGSLPWIKNTWMPTHASRMIWAFLLGGVFAVIGVVLPPLMYSGRLASTIFPEGRGKARWYMFDKQLGRKQFVQSVGFGGVGVKDEKESENAASMLGGPGNVTVEEGYATVIERGGKTVRVLGPGLHWLGKGERATMRIFLYPRTLTVELKNVLTRDQFMLESVKIMVGHEILRRDPDALLELPATTGSPVDAAGKPAERYPYDEKIILERIWNPERTRLSDWVGMVEALTKTIGAQFVMRHDLEDLVSAGGTAQVEIERQVRDELNRQLHPQGIHITATRLGEMEIPKPVLEQLHDRSLTTLKSQTKLLEADNRHALSVRKGNAEQQTMERMARFKSELREALVKQLTAPLLVKDGAFADPNVAIRYIEAMERISQQMLRDDFTTQRFIEAMEKLIDAEGEKHFYFPDPRDIIGLGVPLSKDRQGLS